MSHNKERSEKICLNCNAELNGRYCHLCGQENTEPKESFWSLITHYAYDITHFDGKFFSTVKYLVTKPGFLSSEFMAGRRASYLHPIRMYVFTSAFFFLIFFSLYKFENVNLAGGTKLTPAAIDSIRNVEVEVQEALLLGAKTQKDSAKILASINKIRRNDYRVVTVKDSAGKKFKKPVGFTYDESKYETQAAYDSAQRALPEEDRDSWLERKMMTRRIAIFQKYNGDGQAILSAWYNRFMHSFPQLFFISLPIYAFGLYLLYARRTRDFYYTNHIIFTLHLYIFTYLMLLLLFGFRELDEVMPSSIWNWLQFAIWVWIAYYTFRAMHKFYRQRKLKTFVKYLLLGFISTFFIIILFIIFTILSVYQI
ncbi:MAG: DUF3667 domain-containing protein [Gemmatimonadaceae bacterium]|nr:DUF3667 domain-containing protein [Chitinophagaceae bacterium]